MRIAGQRELIGESAPFQAVLEQVQVVAPVDSTALIQAETGTGKELIARAIHAASRRSAGPFITVNCAAIPTGLLESELFGHERGAFTGALAQRIGRFQLAHRGTLFLDEVGELPIDLQPKLLRAIQEQEIERLGGSQSVPVDVRIVAATNQNLLQMVAERKFRADLYYRLHVFPITLPALRERTKDIPLLVRHFAALFAARMSKPIPWMPEGVMDAFLQYSWPGNVRELQNLVERAVLIGNFHQVAPAREQMPGPRLVHTGPCGRTLHEMERLHITDALEETNWIVGGRAGAAAKLGLPRTTLMSRMRKLGISRETPPAARSRSTPAEAFMMSRSGGAFAHSAGL